MPFYDWVDKTSGKDVQVLRNFDEYEDEPTAEEARMTEEEYTLAEWERLIMGKRTMTRGDNWGGRKGAWAVLLAGSLPTIHGILDLIGLHT